MSEPIFDLTIFDTDDETPILGSIDEYGISEATFSTDPTHPRPYLQEVSNFSSTEVRFAEGSSEIGAVSVPVVDKRTDPEDQNTGLVTLMAGQLVGARAVWRRYRDDLSAFQILFEGVIGSYSLGKNTEGLVVYLCQLKDARWRESQTTLFERNDTFALWGKDGNNGPVENYGELPGGGYLLDAVEPATGVFNRLNDEEYPLDDIYFGFVYTGPIPPLALNGVGNPYRFGSFQGTGIWSYENFALKWRQQGSSDPWTYLRNMPVSNYQYAVQSPDRLYVLGPGGPRPRSPSLYFGSFDSDEVPADGQSIEFLVLAVRTTEETPLFWDQGTRGDLLRACYDGDFSEEDPRVRYSDTAMAAFQTASHRCRIIAREPVRSMKTWVEEQCYRPEGYAPGFDADMQIAPVCWFLPHDQIDLPVIDADSLVPIGDFQHASDTVLNTLEAKFVQENLQPHEVTIQRTGRRKYLIAGPRKKVEVEDDLTKWERFFEDELERDFIEADSVIRFGTQKVELGTSTPSTMREIGTVDGVVAGGDTQDGISGQLIERLWEEIRNRFASGARRFEGTVLATPDNLDLTVGQWIWLHATFPPNYETGERMGESGELMQIYGISDEEPHLRRLLLSSGGVTKDNEYDCGFECGPVLAGGEEFEIGGCRYHVFRNAGPAEIEVLHDGTILALVIADGGSSHMSGAGAGRYVVAMPKTEDVKSGRVIQLGVGSEDLNDILDSQGSYLGMSGLTPIYQSLRGADGVTPLNNISAKDGLSGGSGSGGAGKTIGLNVGQPGDTTPETTPGGHNGGFGAGYPEDPRSAPPPIVNYRPRAGGGGGGAGGQGGDATGPTGDPPYCFGGDGGLGWDQANDDFPFPCAELGIGNPAGWFCGGSPGVDNNGTEGATPSGQGDNTGGGDSTGIIVIRCAPCSVVGSLVDADTGLPITSGSVEIDSDYGFGDGIDSEGAFNIPLIPDGDYTVTLTLPGYETQVVPVTIVSGTSFEIALELTALPTGTIAGVVTRASDDEPLEGVSVSVTGTPWTATTAADGSYSIEGVAIGTWDVLFSLEGYDSVTETGVLVEEEATTPVSAVLEVEELSYVARHDAKDEDAFTYDSGAIIAEWAPSQGDPSLLLIGEFYTPDSEPERIEVGISGFPSVEYVGTRYLEGIIREMAGSSAFAFALECRLDDLAGRTATFLHAYQYDTGDANTSEEVLKIQAVVSGGSHKFRVSGRRRLADSIDTVESAAVISGGQQNVIFAWNVEEARFLIWLDGVSVLDTAFGTAGEFEAPDDGDLYGQWGTEHDFDADFAPINGLRGLVGEQRTYDQVPSDLQAVVVYEDMHEDWI